MNENDKFMFKSLFVDFALPVGILSAIPLIIVIVLSGGENETLMKPYAEVVDTYKGCDVVRWSTNKMDEYKYFLHCEKNK